MSSASISPRASDASYTPTLTRNNSMSTKYSTEASNNTGIADIQAYIQFQSTIEPSNLVRTYRVSEYYPDNHLGKIPIDRATMALIQIARYGRERDGCDPCGENSQSSN